MALKVNPKRLRETLTTYQGYLETKPDNWINLEIVGRCLQYLHDPQAQEYFRRATEFYVLVPENVDRQTVLANLYRLAGETDQARQHYQQAYDLLMPFDFADRANDIKLDRLALYAYMLGNDPLTIKAVTHLRPMCRKGEWLSVFALEALAEARQQGDVARAQETVTTTEAVIRNHRYQLWMEATMLSPWDAYNEARRVVRELGGDPDAPVVQAGGS